MLYDLFNAKELPSTILKITVMGNFKIVEREVVGDLEITENTQINNLNAENVIIHENITARLFGNINKLLTLKKGSIVILHGEMVGDIKNEGGKFSLFEEDI